MAYTAKTNIICGGVMHPAGSAFPAEGVDADKETIDDLLKSGALEKSGAPAKSEDKPEDKSEGKSEEKKHKHHKRHKHDKEDA